MQQSHTVNNLFYGPYMISKYMTIQLKLHLCCTCISFKKLVRQYKHLTTSLMWVTSGFIFSSDQLVTSIPNLKVLQPSTWRELQHVHSDCQYI
jgi:hypothetical protein